MTAASAEDERLRIVEAADAAQHAAATISSKQAASEVWAATVEAAIEQELLMVEQERQEAEAEAYGLTSLAKKGNSAGGWRAQDGGGRAASESYRTQPSSGTILARR